ncbi:hypothetical protein HDU76_007937 [Blyttiomyces sp. JEL0837]|nr:hypothetical protein HDU76_007937 [Blyttiomyces sp. JEL0837]
MMFTTIPPPLPTQSIYSHTSTTTGGGYLVLPPGNSTLPQEPWIPAAPPTAIVTPSTVQHVFQPAPHNNTRFLTDTDFAAFVQSVHSTAGNLELNTSSGTSISSSTSNSISQAVQLPSPNIINQLPPAPHENEYTTGFNSSMANTTLDYNIPSGDNINISKGLVTNVTCGGTNSTSATNSGNITTNKVVPPRKRRRHLPNAPPELIAQMNSIGSGGGSNVKMEPIDLEVSNLISTSTASTAASSFSRVLLIPTTTTNATTTTTTFLNNITAETYQLDPFGRGQFAGMITPPSSNSAVTTPASGGSGDSVVQQTPFNPLRPFKCSQCPKDFKTKAHLRDHK